MEQNLALHFVNTKKTFIVAEISANHGQNFNRAASLIRKAKQAGADACPPFVVGVGIGGNFEASCLLSKKALLRNLGHKNSDEFYAKLEADLLSAINSLGLGPQGLGGDTTALACLVETALCHITSLPVAVNIECHSHRHRQAVI